jgi:hypothetical protein
MCQWVKHQNGVNVDNYGLTLVDLKNVGHQDDPCVLTDRVTHVSVNIKKIDKDFDKNLMLYM